MGTLGPTVIGMYEVHLPTYRVTIAGGLLDRLGEAVADAVRGHRYALVTDSNVRDLYAARALTALPPGTVGPLVVPAGEAHKTRESWARLTDEMLAAGCGRDTVVVALGGGVVGDLAGFVAATFMRGVPYVQVPTTLLAMIDASIGGKTAVDTPAGKNLVGAFHPPAAVLVDPTTLATLPRRELRAGLAEALKHGAIADEAYFERVSGAAPGLLAATGLTGLAVRALAPDAPDVAETLDEIIARSVAIKADVVRQDEREGGVRKILNFGHTLGHAIEQVSGYALLHGEAVAIGMALEAELAEVAGVAECGTASRLRDALVRAGLPVERPPEMSADSILQATRSDKKARRGAAQYALPRRIGAMAGEGEGWSLAIDDDLVREVLA